MIDIFSLDGNMLFWFNSWIFAYPWLDTFVVFFLDWGLIWLFIFFGLLSGMAFLPRFRNEKVSLARMAALGLISVFFARVGAVSLLRFFIPRSRPFEDIETLSLLTTQGVFGTPYQGIPSFPSGHATVTFALAASVAFFYPKISVFFFLGAALVSFARVAGGFHWPSDIFAGAAVGILTPWIVYKVFTKTSRL